MKVFYRLALCAVAILLIGCRAATPAVGSTAENSGAALGLSSSSAIVAEGRLVPRQSADLAFSVGGTVVAVKAAEGDRVAAGQPLIVVESDTQRTTLAQAEAGVAAAQASLAALITGARDEELAAADAAVAAAQAALDVAKAQTEAAQAGAAAAAGQVADARAVLDDVQAGATETELELARRAVERAENDLWAAQAARDGIGGAVDRGQAKDYDLDGAEAAVNVAEANLQIARTQFAQLQAAPRAVDLARAQAALQVAQAGQQQAAANARVAAAQVAAAQASLAGAQAQADLLRAGATTAQVDAARAELARAEAAVDGASAALAARTLVAPFDGTVAALDIGVGEQAAAGVTVVRLADLDHWLVETQDLTESNVVALAVGQTARMAADALPDLALAGTIESISPYYGEDRGDVTYTVRLALESIDPRLRWGMTLVVTFD